MVSSDIIQIRISIPSNNNFNNMTMSIQMFILDHFDRLLAFLFIVNNFLFLPDLRENLYHNKKN